jgi:flavin-dependent dehydrogenase
MMEYDVVIVGGGLAGCAAAITIMQSAPRAKVLVLERGCYPRHKVCGEFVSPEGVAALGKLLDPPDVALLLNKIPPLALANIHVDGRILSAPIRPAAASITRYDLDFALWLQAKKLGAECHEKSPVLKALGEGPFEIATQRGSIHSASLLNAAGRWSVFTQGKTKISNDALNKWIGLKAHFTEDIAPNAIDLYLFHGGYCGVQPVGPGEANACAMVRTEVAISLGEVCELHPDLSIRSQSWIPVMETVTTSPLYFRKPLPVERGMLNAGDAAGFIDPFVGDGMTLALHSGILAGEALTAFLKKECTLAAAIGIYHHQYTVKLLPAFHRARWVRKMISLPGLVRVPLSRLIQMTGATESLLKATRIAT